MRGFDSLTTCQTLLRATARVAQPTRARPASLREAPAKIDGPGFTIGPTTVTRRTRRYDAGFISRMARGGSEVRYHIDAHGQVVKRKGKWLQPTDRRFDSGPDLQRTKERASVAQRWSARLSSGRPRDRHPSGAPRWGIAQLINLPAWCNRKPRCAQNAVSRERGGGSSPSAGTTVPSSIG